MSIMLFIAYAILHYMIRTFKCRNSRTWVTGPLPFRRGDEYCKTLNSPKTVYTQDSSLNLYPRTSAAIIQSCAYELSILNIHSIHIALFVFTLLYFKTYSNG